MKVQKPTNYTDIYRFWIVNDKVKFNIQWFSFLRLEN